MNVPKEVNQFHVSFHQIFYFSISILIAFIQLNVTTLYYNKQNSHPIQIVKMPPFDYCKTIKKTISNPMLKLMLNVFNETQPGLVHECPYSVH